MNLRFWDRRQRLSRWPEQPPTMTTATDLTPEAARLRREMKTTFSGLSQRARLEVAKEVMLALEENWREDDVENRGTLSFSDLTQELLKWSFKDASEVRLGGASA
jgi:hypothetical protein